MELLLATTVAAWAMLVRRATRVYRRWADVKDREEWLVEKAGADAEKKLLICEPEPPPTPHVTIWPAGYGQTRRNYRR